jgi:parallel beta-helix repeat protein
MPAKLQGAVSAASLAAILGLAVVAAVAPSTALGHADAPEVDQSFTSPSDLDAVINDCCNFVAQTFTAGRDGSLAGVNVDIQDANEPPEDGPLRVTIRNTRHGLPGQRVLATKVLESQHAPLSRLITFPQQPLIHSGVRYAIVVNLENPSPSDRANWVGATGDRYPRGDLCLGGDDGVTWSCDTSEGFDVHFRTYLNALPPSPPPNCGDTITADTTLHHSLVNCPNNGIVVGADDVTLDLNYHTIDGDGTPNTDCNPAHERCDVGVDVEGHDGVTVVHGSVRQFEDGIIAAAARRTRVLGVSSSSNHYSGIVISRCARSLVRNSSGIGSTADVGQGIFLVLSDRVRIVHSSFRDNGIPQTGRGLGVGINLFQSTHTLIEGNRLSHNAGAGILLDGDGNRVRRNHSVRDNEVAIWIAPGSENVIARNRVAHLRQTGHGEGAAIQVDGGDRNVLARNSVRDSEGDAIGVRGSLRAVGNVVRRNKVVGAGKDGIHVMAKAVHTQLRGNRARHSKDDGLDVEVRATKLTRNRAVRNGDLGIEAVRGVIDGGRNHARRNGDPRQCTHIACN